MVFLLYLSMLTHKLFPVDRYNDLLFHLVTTNFYDITIPMLGFLEKSLILSTLDSVNQKSSFSSG